MTDKTIEELIEEARELGVDIHTHVAKEMFGTVNMNTRQLAKQMTFGASYGGSPDVAKKLDSGYPLKLTEEQLKARVPLKLTQEHMNEPYRHYEDCPAVDTPWPLNYWPPATNHPQSEDRMHRVGVRPYKIQVFDTYGAIDVHTIHATSELDARCIAYLIDYGHSVQHWDDGHIELALAHTEIIE